MYHLEVWPPCLDPRHVCVSENFLTVSYVVTAHPEIMQELKSKDDDLVSRMNKLKIEQTAPSMQQVYVKYYIYLSSREGAFLNQKKC